MITSTRECGSRISSRPLTPDRAWKRKNGPLKTRASIFSTNIALRPLSASECEHLKETYTYYYRLFLQSFSPPSFDVGRSADHRANRWLCLTACPVCSQCTTPDSALSPDQYARNDPNDGALVEKRHEQTGGKRAARWAIWWEGSERPLEYFISPCTTLKGMPMQDGSVTRFCDRSFPAFPLNR